MFVNYKRKDGRRIMYITYEEPLKGKTFTEKQMYEVYRLESRHA